MVHGTPLRAAQRSRLEGHGLGGEPTKARID
jgi:hypothetical protein